MGEQMTAQYTSIKLSGPCAAPLDPVSAAEVVLRRYAPRAISMLTSTRQMEDGRWATARLSANDCYVALDEACRKVTRVALRKYSESYAPDGVDFSAALPMIFPDPAAYLARAIKSVVSDEGRSSRREIPTLSLDQPITADNGEGALHLSDTVRETRTWKLPEQTLVEESERSQFRSALGHALKSIPSNYLDALKRDVAREHERQTGIKVVPESDRERQTVCRARAALSTIIKRECGEDNPFVRLLSQQRSSRVRRKVLPTGDWSGERQETLFRKLMQTGWSERAAVAAGESVDEAVINEVSAAKNTASPSPELRQAMRVMDVYTVDYPTPRTPMAQEMYTRARALRQAGQIEEALRCFRACYDAEPTFIEALNNVGNLHSQLGNLRDALKVFLSIIELDPPGGHKYIAATNAADIYLTWFDAGRNRDHNIQQAIHYASMAMEKPRPMRACNLLLAYVKDRYYSDAKHVLETVLKSNSQDCPAEKFLQTLFQIRDADLVTWWTWLENELDNGVLGQ